MAALSSDIVLEVIDSLVEARSRSVFAYGRTIVQTLLSLCLVNRVCNRRASFYLYMCMDLRTPASVSQLDADGIREGLMIRSMFIHKGCFQAHGASSITNNQLQAVPETVIQASRLIHRSTPTLERLYLDSVPLLYSFQLEATFSHLPHLHDVAITVDFFPIFSSRIRTEPCPSVSRVAVYDRSRRPHAYTDALLPRFPNVKILVLAWRDIDLAAVEAIVTSQKKLVRLVVILPPRSHIVLRHEGELQTTITGKEKTLVAARYPHIAFVDRRAPDEPPASMTSWTKRLIRNGDAWDLSGTAW